MLGSAHLYSSTSHLPFDLIWIFPIRFQTLDFSTNSNKFDKIINSIP
jgi:hypothetical protein